MIVRYTVGVDEKTYKNVVSRKQYKNLAEYPYPLCELGRYIIKRRKKIARCFFLYYSEKQQQIGKRIIIYIL